MRDDFCVFILTHGRPEKVETYRTLRSHGYTGHIFIVIDDEDETGDEYRKQFGGDVLVFSKDEVSRYIDQFDNFKDRRTVLWARNACWDLAKQTGYRFFVQLDDDYESWLYRRMGKGNRVSSTDENEFHGWKINNLDLVFNALVEIVETTPIKTIAFSQGGDHQGGRPKRNRFKRKAMNSFVCDTEKPFLFRGRINEDVNTYVSLGRTGELFFTDMELQLNQRQTQTNSGGMTDVYLDSGTYVKSFYTIMVAPSCVKIGLIGNINKRLHHQINWDATAPLIMSEQSKNLSIKGT